MGVYLEISHIVSSGIYSPKSEYWVVASVELLAYSLEIHSALAPSKDGPCLKLVAAQSTLGMGLEAKACKMHLSKPQFHL